MEIHITNLDEAIFRCLALIVIATVIIFISLWKIFSKAGKPGWLSFVPIANLVALHQIIGISQWWLIPHFIPFVNLAALFAVSIAIAKRFNKSVGYGVGIFVLPFVFLPILGFGKSAYDPEPSA